MTLKAIHLLTNPSDEREQRSIKDISSLSYFGIEYIQIINPKFDGEMDPNQRERGGRPFELNKGHYGCYKAHKDAIFKYLNDDTDGLLIFECDSIFAFDIHKIRNRISRAIEACKKYDLLTFTFGPKHGGKMIDDYGDIMTITQFIETHAYYIPGKSKEIFFDVLNKPWDALDYVYTIYLYDQAKHKIGTFKDRATFVQANGISLIDNTFKTSEDYWKQAKYKDMK